MPKSKQFDETEVLQKAREVFWQKGYNGTSMDELVRATGLSRSSIYDTFGDKHGLFVRSIQLYQQDQRDAIAEFLKDGSSPKKKIQWFFQKTIKEILEDKQQKGCFIVNVVTELSGIDKKVSALACTEIQRVEDLLFSWVREGQAAGEINNKIPARAMARFLQNNLSGMRITGQAHSSKAALEDIVATTLFVLEP